MYSKFQPPVERVQCWMSINARPLSSRRLDLVIYGQGQKISPQKEKSRLLRRLSWLGWRQQVTLQEGIHCYPQEEDLAPERRYPCTFTSLSPSGKTSTWMSWCTKMCHWSCQHEHWIFCVLQNHPFVAKLFQSPFFGRPFAFETEKGPSSSKSSG